MTGYEWDDVLNDCLVCGGRDIRENLTDCRGVAISRCGSCGFQFMNPQYSDRYLAAYYAQYLDGDECEVWREASTYDHRFYFSLIERHVRPGRMFDVGCGSGLLLETAVSRGWKGGGFDVDEKSTQRVAGRLGVRVHCGDFLSSDLGGGYDLVTMHQVLEHLKNPGEYLEKIRGMIREGGIFFVAVPNIRSLSNRLKYGLEQRGLRRKNIGKYYDTVHHLQYFEPGTLARLLERNGFEVLYRRNCRGTRPNHSRLKRAIDRNLTDHLFAKSAFLMIAKRI